MKPILDISYWQPPSEINYDLLAGSISGVILRACYAIGKDTRFDRHYQEFEARGIPVGAYHYITGNVGAQAQAEAFRNAVDGKTLRLGLWADVEDIREGTRLTRQHVIDYMTAAEGLLGELGIYTSRYLWNDIMGSGAHPYTGRKLWVANYGVSVPALPFGWNSWWLWQYSSKGDLPGYNGNLDMNHFWGTDADYAAWVGGEIPEPPVVEEPIYQVEVIAGALNIRSGAGTEYGVIRTVLKGTILDVYEQSGLWLRVGVGKYCSGNPAYVRRVELSLQQQIDALDRRVTALEGG